MVNDILAATFVGFRDALRPCCLKAIKDEADRRILMGEQLVDGMEVECPVHPKHGVLVLNGKMWVHKVAAPAANAPAANAPAANAPATESEPVAV